VIGIRYIKIDARDVSEIVAVLVSLEKEMPAIIVARRGTTRIMIENEISVFVRLGATTVAEVSESRNEPEGFSSRSRPWATSPAVNSGDKTLGEITTGLAAGTPLTFSLKTLTWLSAAAFEAAMVTSAIMMATNEQDLACSEFLRVNFMVYLCWIGLF
jgi:hypothetical protein